MLPRGGNKKRANIRFAKRVPIKPDLRPHSTVTKVTTCRQIIGATNLMSGVSFRKKASSAAVVAQIPIPNEHFTMSGSLLRT